MWWGGLEYGGKYSLMDGSVGIWNWYYAIGANSFWKGGIPGFAKPMAIVELYVASYSKCYIISFCGISITKEVIIIIFLCDEGRIKKY